MTSFTNQIYALTKKIPLGKVATYGQLAALVGSPGAARAVGGCMRTNPYAPVVPCHRVVGHTGQLTGYSAGEGISSKRQLLEQEGVFFTGSRVDLRRSQWQPSEQEITGLLQE